MGPVMPNIYALFKGTTHRYVSYTSISLVRDTLKEPWQRVTSAYPADSTSDSLLIRLSVTGFDSCLRAAVHHYTQHGKIFITHWYVLGVLKDPVLTVEFINVETPDGDWSLPLDYPAQVTKAIVASVNILYEILIEDGQVQLVQEQEFAWDL
jgi:hypothetical protein